MPRSTLIALALAVAVAAAVGVVALGNGPTATGAAGRGPEKVLGVLPNRVPLQLARLDPATLHLRPTPRVDVGYPACAPRAGGEACWGIPPWSLQGGRLAVARNRPHEAGSILLIDPKRPRTTTTIPLTGGPIGLVSWVGPDHLLALQEVCCDERQQILTLDVARRGILAAVPVDGSVLRVARTPRELVALVAPPNAIGTPQLEVAGDGGIVRDIALDRIQAGIRLTDPSAHRVRQRVPGLAVDPAGRRAFVVAPRVVAEVRLDDLSVSYHALTRSASLIDRLHEWLEPAAEAKDTSGPVRTAAWLEPDRLAVGGDGLSIVDTRTWRERTLNQKASDVRTASDLLLATGPGAGLTAYDLEGRERFRLLAGKSAWVDQVYAGRAYVGLAGVDGLQVVDLASGRAVGRRAQPLPWLLTAPAASWWD